MVKFEIRNEEEKDKPKEKMLKVFLEQDSDGEVNIWVEEANGDRWRVAMFIKEGRLFLEEGIPNDIGLDVDEEGRIKIEK